LLGNPSTDPDVWLSAASESGLPVTQNDSFGLVRFCTRPISRTGRLAVTRSGMDVGTSSFPGRLSSKPDNGQGKVDEVGSVRPRRRKLAGRKTARRDVNQDVNRA
jgi:hypothetical protein